MAQCNILPQAPNGADSELFRETLEKTNDRNAAIIAYGISRSKVFKNWQEKTKQAKDRNGEATFSSVKQFQQNHITPNVLVDDLIPTASSPIQAVRRKKLRNAYKTLKGLRLQFKNNTNPKERNKLTPEIEKVEAIVKEIEKEMQDLKEIKNITTVYNAAENDLSDLDKIFSKDNISFEDIFFTEKIISTWKKAGDFSQEEHIFLDDDERNTPEIVAKFTEYKNRVEGYEFKLNKVKKERLEEFVNAQFDATISRDEIYKIMKDDWGIAANTLNIGRQDNVILQAIHRAVENANFLAQQESVDRFKKLDELVEKALPKLKAFGNTNPYEIFKQKTTNGKLTGNMVFRFSQDFFSKKNFMSKRAFDNPAASDSALKRYRKEWHEWENANVIHFDPRILFSDGKGEESDIDDKHLYSPFEGTLEDLEGQREEHIAELKSHLGEKGFVTYMKKFEDNMENFRLAREAAFDNFTSNTELSPGERETQFQEWIALNSPYLYMEMKKTDSKLRSRADGAGRNVSFAYSISVPKRAKESGEDTTWYDNDFNTIESDEDILNLYNHMLDILSEARSVLPEDKTTLLQMNSLPTIEASIIDQFSDKGMAMGIMPLWDKMKEAIREDDLSTEGSTDEEKRLNVQFLPDNREKIARNVDLQIIEFTTQMGREPSRAEISEMRETIIDEIAQEKSYDLGKILKAYSLMSLAHKHKSVIEDQVNLANQMFSEAKAGETNAAGEFLTDRETGKPIKEGNLTKLNDALEYFLNESFYSIPSRAIEAKTSKKVFTSKEKQKKVRIEKALADLEIEIENAPLAKKEKLEQRKANLEKELKELGGIIVGSSIGDVALKYIQLKGMGWNIFSAFSNIGFGYISNYIEGADGRSYNIKQFRKAMLMTTDSVAANFTFDSFKTDRAKKIRNLMDRLDVLQQSADELYKRSNESSLSKNTKFLGPYTPQQKSEYVNQAPVMIAMMLNTEAIGPDGEVTDLWEATDGEGNIKEGYSVGEKGNAAAIVSFKSKLKKIIEQNHGDYGNPLLAKKTFLGRSASQFRTWMFEGFASRFEKEYQDYTLGYKRKGRYRTGFGVFGWAQGTGMNGIEQTLFNIKQLGRKLLFQPTKFDERFNEVDAANMRKNLNELVVYMTLIMLSLLLEKMLPEDDEEKKSPLMVNFLINHANRLQTDILFYTSPIEFEKLTQSALPIMALVDDAAGWFKAAGRQFGDHPNVQTGPLEGMNWLVRRTGEGIPGPSQGIRLYKNFVKIIGE